MNPRKVSLERRRFLQLVGASAVTYPFLRGVPSYAAASGASPTYLVLVFTPCGCVRPVWGATDSSGNSIARPAAGSAATVTGSFTFRNSLAPFAKGGSVGGTTGGTSWTTSLQNKVIVLDGLNNKAAQGSHEAGMASLWTGQISSGSPATSLSIDQQIATKLAAGTPFPTIQLMVRDPADFTDREVKTRMIYNSSGVYVDPIDNPTSAAATFFPGMSGAGSGGPDKNTFIRQQLFGSPTATLNSELNNLMPKLCTEDRAQLQALQDGWNNLYTQLQAAAAAAQKCMPPGSVPAKPDFPTSCKLQMDILALALACDLTRVASLQFSTATSQVTHSWLGSNQTDCHHNYSHDGPTYMGALAMCAGYDNSGKCTGYSDIYSSTNLNLYQNAAQQEAIDAFYATQVAYLGQRLGGLTGISGGSLLDQSVICWGNELDMGAAHNHDDTPFVLVGGANGQLKTGNLVTFPLDLSGSSQPTMPSKTDRSHNDLLLTLAKVMGVPLTTFGEASFCTGPISEILA